MLVNLIVSALIVLSDQMFDAQRKSGWKQLAIVEEKADTKNLVVEGTVVDMSSMGKVGQMPEGSSGGRLEVEGIVEQLWPEENQIEVQLDSDQQGLFLVLLVPESGCVLPQIGNRLKVIGEPWDFREATVPGQFDERSYYESSGYQGRIQAEEWQVTETSIVWWRQKLWQLRQKLVKVYQRELPEAEADVLMAMTLGDKSGLDTEIRNSYQENGISHLLAVSGLHISLLGGAVLYFLRKIRCGPILAGSITILFIISYGILIDYPVATNRAVVMMVLYILAGMAGRTYDMPTALSCALFVIVCQSPDEIYQAGMQMSFGAVLGILLLVPVWKVEKEAGTASMRQHGARAVWGGIKKNIAGSLVISLATMLMTAPIQMYHFYEISLSGLWNNLLVIPLMPVLLLTGIIGGLMGMVPGNMGQLAGRFLLGSSYTILNIYDRLCQVGEKLDWAEWITGRPAMWQLILYYGMLSGVVLWCNHSRKGQQSSAQADGELFYNKRLLSLGRLAVMGLAVVFLLLRFPENSVTVLDVGQGDGIVISSSAGNTFLVDGGSSDVSGVGTWRLIPYLKQEGVRRLAGVFVSHADSDHISGVLELLEEGDINVDCLILSDVYKKQESLQGENYEKLLAVAQKQNVSIRYLRPGDIIRDGQVEFCCLGPDVDSSYEDQNDASLVLLTRIEETNILLTGDISTEVDQKLIKKYELDVDVLKVAHHGSRYSTSEGFLEWCQPEVALISCGKKNMYGHPHQEVLERLEGSDCQIYTTAECGSIRLTWEK